MASCGNSGHYCWLDKEGLRRLASIVASLRRRMKESSGTLRDLHCIQIRRVFRAGHVDLIFGTLLLPNAGHSIGVRKIQYMSQDQT